MARKFFNQFSMEQVLCASVYRQKSGGLAMIDLVHLLGSSFVPFKTANQSCPICKTPHVGRTRRRFVDRLISQLVPLKRCRWRTRRRFVDHLISQLVPLKRCRCTLCGWEGNLVINKK